MRNSSTLTEPDSSGGNPFHSGTYRWPAIAVRTLPRRQWSETDASRRERRCVLGPTQILFPFTIGLRSGIAPWVRWQTRNCFTMNSSNQRDPSLDWSRRPLLLVVGMHRSGTSAITGSLGVLGFNTPHVRDRMGFSSASNAEHWESLSLSAYNDHLLAKLGGSWDAPPDLPLRWEHGDPEPVGLCPAGSEQGVPTTRSICLEGSPLVSSPSAVEEDSPEPSRRHFDMAFATRSSSIPPRSGTDSTLQMDSPYGSATTARHYAISRALIPIYATMRRYCAIQRDAEPNCGLVEHAPTAVRPNWAMASRAVRRIDRSKQHGYRGR